MTRPPLERAMRLSPDARRRSDQHSVPGVPWALAHPSPDSDARRGCASSGLAHGGDSRCAAASSAERPRRSEKRRLPVLPSATTARGTRRCTLDLPTQRYTEQWRWPMARAARPSAPIAVPSVRRLRGAWPGPVLKRGGDVRQGSPALQRADAGTDGRSLRTEPQRPAPSGYAGVAAATASPRADTPAWLLQRS